VGTAFVMSTTLAKIAPSKPVQTNAHIMDSALEASVVASVGGLVLIALCVLVTTTALVMATASTALAHAIVVSRVLIAPPQLAARIALVTESV